MNYLVKIFSSSFDSANRRVLKFLRLGKSDVQTSLEAMPFGVDSSPIKDMRAIYAETSNDGKAVIIGYLNKNQLAQDGETRLFSIDANGNLKSELWLKKDGTIWFNGSGDFLTKWNPLNQAMSTLASNINTELGKIATGITAGGGSYTPSPISININDAKASDLKTGS